MQSQNVIVGPDDTQVLPTDDYHQIPVTECVGAQLTSHFEEIASFARTHNVSLARAAGHMVEPTDDSDSDVCVDILERNNIKLVGDRWGPASDAARVFDNRALAAFGTQYVQDSYFYQIHDAAFWRIGKPRMPGFQPQSANTQSLFASFVRNIGEAFRSIVEFSGAAGGDARSALPDGYAFNPPTIGSVMPKKVLFQDLEVADITGDVVEITGSRYTAPKVTEPKNYKLTGIGEFGTIPKWRTGLGETTAETLKAGYGQECSYEFLRTGGETMEGLAQFAMWLGFLTTAEIVDRGIQLAASTGARTHAAGVATFDSKKTVIKMLSDRVRGVQYSIVVGNSDFYVEYAASDITFSSANQAPLTVTDRNRVFLNTPMGRQQITWRTGSEVAALSGTDPKGILMDQRFTLRYLFGRNSNIDEQDIEAGEQYVSFYRTFEFLWMLMQMADDARMVATLS